MKKKYDYLIVGAGLFGATFAFEMSKCGKKCLIVERRAHIGGNVFSKETDGISVHLYGPHIFHTDKKEIWDYVNQFVTFKPFSYSPIANYKGEIFNLPFNMNTFNRLWGVVTPEEAKTKIEEQKKGYEVADPQNLESQAIAQVGPELYEKLIKGYTEKQWGMKATELPPFIISRLPVRFTYDNRYFNDAYQGIPVEGYTAMIEKMLKGVEVWLETDYFSDKEVLDSSAARVVFTGMIDEYFEYRYGPLKYRSLRFEHEVMEIENYQGNAVVNYTDSETPFTRVIEHKHFTYGTQPGTVITREYPMAWKPGKEPFYPINNEKNMERYCKYKKLADKTDKVVFGGRLAEYKYYDMHQVIGSALEAAKNELIQKPADNPCGV